MLAKNLRKDKKGITLVALVITIIIIIILATIATNYAFGDNGLITKAELARNLTANSIAYEEESLANVVARLDEMLGDDGDVTDGWDLDKVTPVESEDGVTVPVPKGYTASDVEGENTVAGGFVIYELLSGENEGEVSIKGDEDATTTRNQFVWIPVDDIDLIANETSGEDDNGRTNYQGKLYNFSSTGVTEKESTLYKEPAILTSYDADTTYLSILNLESSDDFLKQLQKEFNEMIESIDTYGGFYIGRYETGNLATTEPVVRKGNYNISSVNWYYMYQNSKLIAVDSNVVTTMIWGCLWDRTLIWLAETYEESDGTYGKSYDKIVDSSDWGNYNSSKKTTGSDESWKANNIYDLAGNEWEWTIEAYSYLTSSRVLRGGSFSHSSGSSYPVSDREYGGNPSLSANNFRVTSSTLYRAMSSDRDAL